MRTNSSQEKIKERQNEPLGYVIDGSTPITMRFVSTKPPPIGDYVVTMVEEKLVLGFVDHIGSRSITLSTAATIYDPLVVSRLTQLASPDDVFFECSARILGIPSGDRLILSKIPPLPGSPVYHAPEEILREIFGGKPPFKIRIGVLASRPKVPVYVDVNKLATRHLAILAMTGAGKSNTVAVLADRLVRIGGTILIFDFHGEYVDSDLGNKKVHVIKPVLNPSYLTVTELMILLGIESRYYNQERVLRRAYDKIIHSDNGQGPFLERLRKAVEQLRGREEPKAVVAVANKIEALIEKHKDIINDDADDVISRLLPGYANVVDLSKVDEEAADAVVSHFLRRILAERKRFMMEGKGLSVPLMVFIEEAHILAPKDRNTLSKYWLSRIAREGRKFGIGIALISQRPKSLDQDTLSQANNMIILRIVEPTDQKYVQAASETLSDDLLRQLPSLNTGEAIVLGPFIPVPAMVKIDLYEGRKGGADPDVVSEWLQRKQLIDNTIEIAQLVNL